MRISLKSAALSAAFALGALALPGAAAAGPALSGGPLDTVSRAAQLPVERAASVSFQYSPRYHGRRYRTARRGYPYSYGGYYYQRPYWQPRYRTYYPRRYRSGPSVSFGLSFGGGYGGYVEPRRYRRRGGGSAHVAWCSDRYRTYDARTDTFIARVGGPRVRCRSPY